MSLVQIKNALFKAARAEKPNEAVPYAFEQRVMARIRAARPIAADPLLDWSRALFRAALPCFVATLLMAAWNYQHSRALVASSQANESNLMMTQELAMAVLDSIDAPEIGEDLP